MAKNPNKIKNGSIVATAIIYVILALLALICLYPIWYVIIISFSRPIAARTLDVFLIPKGFYTGSYTQLFKDTQMWTTYGNTLIYASTCVVGMLITSAMAAYPLTSPYLIGKKFWVFFILILMYFSGGLIPQYIIMSKLHMINSVWALILPGGVSVYNVIVVRTFFENSIPAELYEAANIDGSGNIRTFLKIALPLSKPILAVMVIFTMVAYWNDWFTALIYMNDDSRNPLQLVLRQILINSQAMATMMGNMDGGYAAANKITELIKFASIVVGSVPMLIAYPFVQKYFEKGFMAGAVKG